MKLLSSALLITLSAAIFQSAVIGQSAQSDCEIVLQVYKTAGGSASNCQDVPGITYDVDKTKIMLM